VVAVRRPSLVIVSEIPTLCICYDMFLAIVIVVGTMGLAANVTLAILYPMEMARYFETQEEFNKSKAISSELIKKLADMKDMYRGMKNKYLDATDALSSFKNGSKTCDEIHMMDVIDGYVPMDVYQDLLKEVDTSNSWSDDFDTFLVARLTKPNDNDLKHMLIVADVGNFDKFAALLAQHPDRMKAMQQSLLVYGNSR